MSAAPAPAELARAARVLRLRARREATSAFGGAYRSAFRGSGADFEELRPYAPGDEVRDLDWNATARTGTPFVRRYREERDLTLLLLVDVSASMDFGTAGRTKAALAAHAAALLAAAAGRAGDRVGLLTFDDGVRDEALPDRGPAHVHRVLRLAVAAAGRPGGGTGLSCALSRVPRHAHRPAIVCVLSDFRDPALAGGGGAAGRDPAGVMAALSRRHDLVSIALHDPRETAIPAAGLVRFADPEAPRRIRVLDASDPVLRARYRAAGAARRRSLERRLREAGSDVLWLGTDEEPLRVLARYFRSRTGRRELAR